MMQTNDIRLVRWFVLDRKRAGGLTRRVLVRELEWNDARNGSKNLTTAPSRRRPHACINRRSFCFALANRQRPSADRSPGDRRAAAWLGCDLRQGVLPGGERRTCPAYALCQMAVAAFLRTAAQRRYGCNRARRRRPGLRAAAKGFRSRRAAVGRSRCVDPARQECAGRSGAGV